MAYDSCLLKMEKKDLKIVLMGLPGSGKSTLGKEVAKTLELDFFDLDELIVKDVGCSINRLFATKGEEFFCQKESEMLRKILGAEGSFILSTGGGTPCYNQNITLINENGLSIFLDVPKHILKERLTKNRGCKRPMFRGLDDKAVFDKLDKLEQERSPYYNQAKIKLSGEAIPTELILSKIKAFL